MFFKKRTKKAISPVIEIKSRRKGGTGVARKIFYWIIISAFFGVAAYAVFFAGYLAITDITVRAGEKIDPEEIRQAMFSRLSGKYLNFLPKNNIMLVGEKRTVRFLSEKFKLIERAEVRKDFPNTLAISVWEKNPLLIMRSGGKEYVINDKGIAYARSDFESSFLDGNTLPVLQDESGREISEKSETLEPAYVDFILSVRKRMAEDLGINLVQIVKTPSVISGDIEIETEEGWKARYNMEVGAEKGTEMLGAVLSGKVAKDKRKDLEYVDLRTDNKVYFKFKQLANDEQMKNE